jgi:hypothetical protein
LLETAKTNVHLQMYSMATVFSRLRLLSAVLMQPQRYVFTDATQRMFTDSTDHVKAIEEGTVEESDLLLLAAKRVPPGTTPPIQVAIQGFEFNRILIVIGLKISSQAPLSTCSVQTLVYSQ